MLPHRYIPVQNTYCVDISPSPSIVCVCAPRCPRQLRLTCAMTVAALRLLTAELAVLPGAGGAFTSLVHAGTCDRQGQGQTRCLLSNSTQTLLSDKHATGLLHMKQLMLSARATTAALQFRCAQGVRFNCTNWFCCRPFSFGCCKGAAYRLADGCELLDQQLVVVGDLHQLHCAVAVVNTLVGLGLNTTTAPQQHHDRITHHQSAHHRGRQAATHSGCCGTLHGEAVLSLHGTKDSTVCWCREAECDSGMPCFALLFCASRVCQTAGQ